jgi:hypothetical protein
VGDLADLWPRLLAAGVQWRPGMVAIDGCRVLDVDDRGVPVAWLQSESTAPTLGIRQRIDTAYGSPGFAADEWTRHTPDLNDPATIGCLLGEVERISGGRVTLAGGGLRSGASVVIDYPDGAESYHYPGDLGEDLPDTAGRAILAALAALVLT